MLHNKGVLRKLVEQAGVRSTDNVYEVGCGTGELTMQLLGLAKKVYTIDVEPRMVQETQLRASSAGFSNLEASVGNALTAPMPERFDLCVANLPFQISSPFIFQLLRRLTNGLPWRSAVLVLAQPYAERLLADPGQQVFTRLAVNVRLFVRTVRLFDAHANSFIPAPEVSSTVVRLEPRLPLPRVDFNEWDAMIRCLFFLRKKTLRATFKRITTLSRLEQNYKFWCTSAGKAPDRRPFPQLISDILDEEGVTHQRSYDMDIDDLYRLLLAFNRQGVHFASVHDEGEEVPDYRLDEDFDLGPLHLQRPLAGSAPLLPKAPAGAWLDDVAEQAPFPSTSLTYP